MSDLYYCEDCKMVIREEDLDKVRYEIGNPWGHDAYETEFRCPCCGEVPVEYVEPSVFDDEEIEEPKIYEPKFRREEW